MSARVLVTALAVLATVAFAIALAVRPGNRGAALDAYVLLLGGLGLGLLVHATTRAFPPLTQSALDRALRRRPGPPKRVSELQRLERSVDMSRQSAFDTYYRLRPGLREVAASRLAMAGVDLDSPESPARELLGAEAWSIVGPDVHRPSDHFAPGASLQTIDAAVTALERL